MNVEPGRDATMAEDPVSHKFDANPEKYLAK